AHYNRCMRKYYYDVLWNPQQKEIPQALKDAALELLHCIAETHQRYAQALHKRASYELFGSGLLVDALMERFIDFRKIVESYRKEMEEHHNWRAGTDIELALEKMAAVSVDLSNEGLRRSAKKMESYVNAVVIGLESPWLYAECLATAVALRALIGDPYEP